MRWYLSSILAFVLLGSCHPVFAGWRTPQGLGVIVNGAKEIAVYEIESVNQEKQVIIFRKVEDVRSKSSQQFWLHLSLGVRENGSAPGDDASKWLLKEGKPGKRVVSFSHDLVYVGGYWLQMYPVREDKTPYFKLTEWHAMFGYSFAGSIEELVKASQAILQGKEVVVPVNASTPFVRDMVLTHWRERYPELPLAQLKANTKLDRVPEHRLRGPLDADDPVWTLLVGSGSGRANQLPKWEKQLGDADPVLRAEAARQIGAVGREAKNAIPAVIRRLEDERSPVRVAAAIAVLQFDPKHPTARSVLRKAMRDDDPTVRESVAEGLWILDRDVEGTIPDLVELQRDKAKNVQVMATRALKSFLTAYDLKPISLDDLRVVRQSPDRECATLVNTQPNLPRR